jgi:hypothetical protein
MKLAVLLLVSLVAVLLGSQASAWRRASFCIAQNAKIYRSLKHGEIPEDGLAVSDEMVNEFEPPFVAWRKRVAISLVLLTAGLAWIFFTWYWALATFLTCLVGAELLRAFTLPKPEATYYLLQLFQSFTERAGTAESLNPQAAVELRDRADLLRRMIEQRSERVSEPPQYGA